MTTPFHTAFERATEAALPAQRLADLEYRWNTRFRIWEHMKDQAVAQRASRLANRHRDALNAAEEAEQDLGVAWARVSRALPCRIELGALTFTEPTMQDRLDGLVINTSELLLYGKPPLGALDYGYRSRVKRSHAD